MSKHLKHCKKQKQPFLPVIICVVLLIIVLLGAILLISPIKTIVKNLQPQNYATEAVTKTTTAETQETTAKETTSPVTQEVTLADCDRLVTILDSTEYDVNSIKGEQLIVVDSTSTCAIISYFEKTDGVWNCAADLSDVEGYVGIDGVSTNASEYISHTPYGLYPLGTAFGICDNPGTSMDYFKVTQDSYWVSDVNSAYYNQHVEGTENKDWENAEHLIDYAGSYDYCVFIEYNVNPTVSGKGSAFFLHVGNAPTAGCVAIPRENMIATLQWLDKEKQPSILIL